MNEMKRILGIFILFVVVYITTAVLAYSDGSDFLSGFTQKNLLRRIAPIGILGIGVALVIITGGIDLSLGSMICLVGIGIPWCIAGGLPIWLTLLIALAVSAAIGLFHGLLITKLGLQPFVVTLCGLLMYRGITRGFTGDKTAGLGSDQQSLLWISKTDIDIPFTGGEYGIPISFCILLLIGFLTSLFLNKTIYGRYLMALGNNEEAARLSGIRTDRMIILAYVICSILAGLAGLIYITDVESDQPSSAGNLYELFAIAAAVLGGCSLRGGTGTILGVIIGTALIQLLRQMITIVFPNQQSMEYFMIGAVLLIGVVADELVRRLVAKRRAARAN